MSFYKLLKICPFVILTLLNVHVLSAHAREGGVSGGGGDASESRVNDIRGDILKWIEEGGARALSLPARITYDDYLSSMERYLVPHAVVVGFVTTSQENSSGDSELKVSVDGQPKTCRGFLSNKDSLPHILCNTERFAAAGEAEQYRLVHHEYAGLAGVELNVGASSDYEISNQITGFLVPETVLKLAVAKTGALPVNKGDSIFNSYKLLSDVTGDRPCSKTFKIQKFQWDGEVFQVEDDERAGIRPAYLNQMRWQDTGSSSQGGVTRSIQQSASSSIITFNLVTESYWNPGNGGFNRAFHKDVLTSRETLNLVLNRKTGLLTYVLKTEEPGAKGGNTRVQACLMTLEN